MIQRGRKSASANVVALRAPAARSRLSPPSTLNAAERLVFAETAAQHPHLKPGDVAILSAFAQAAVRAAKLARKDDTKSWELAVRAMLALARSLRLTQISSSRPETLARRRQDAVLDKPWERKGDDEQW